MEDAMRNAAISRRRIRLISVAVLLTAGTMFAAAEKQARTRFNETSWNFGKVKEGEAMTHEFVFTNEGDAPLLIQRVVTSCGCTAALASDDEIGPGKDGRIKATLDTTGYAGKVIKYVYVESNDAGTRRRELTVEAEVEVQPQARIELDRYNIDLGLSLEGEALAAGVTIKNAGELELKVEIADPEFTFRVDGKPAAFPLKLRTGQSVSVEILSPVQKKRGMLRNYILVKSNDPVRSAVSLYVSRYVVTKEELKDLFKKYGKVLGDQ